MAARDALRSMASPPRLTISAAPGAGRDAPQRALERAPRDGCGTRRGSPRPRSSGCSPSRCPNIGSSSDDRRGWPRKRSDQACLGAGRAQGPAAGDRRPGLRPHLVGGRGRRVRRERGPAVEASAGDPPRATAVRCGRGAASVRAAGTRGRTRALACLQTAFPGFPGTPVRLVSASLPGPARIPGFMVEGPVPASPPTP